MVPSESKYTHRKHIVFSIGEFINQFLPKVDQKLLLEKLDFWCCPQGNLLHLRFTVADPEIRQEAKNYIHRFHAPVK